MREDEFLDMLTDCITLESWFEGKTLTVMFDDGGTTKFAKLRLVKIADRPSSADLRGEPS